MAGKKEIKLVPTEEQPYEIPENWCWVYLGDIIELISGRDAAVSSCNDKGVGIPYILGASNIDNNHFTVERWIEKPEVVSRKGDVLLSVKGTIGKTYVQQEECINISRQIMALRPKNGLDTQFLYHLLRSICDELRIAGNGLIPGISRSDILEKAIPLAPLAEQKRIVDTIVDLFADLDKAAENAERIVKQHDERRANLLHSAITGELTDTWRKSHGVDITDWTSSTIDDLCYSLKYGTAKKSKSAGPVVVLRMGNMQEGEIDWTDLAYTDDGEDIAKYHLEPGDVLFNRTNSATHVGKTSIYRGEYPAIYAGYLIKLDYDHSRVIGNYLTYALNTPTAREYCQSVKTDGVNQSNINARKIGAFSIPLPSMEEQQEIVRILDELLGNEQRIKEAAEEMLDKIAMMKKSILADAFRGKLGTNDPADEPATELLRQILA